MRLLCFLVWKSWASSPLRVALTLLGVALGVAVVVAIHVLDHNTILSQIERKRADFGRVDFELRPLSAEPSLADRRKSLAAHEDIERVGLIASTPARVIEDGRDRSLASIYGFAPTDPELFGHYRVAKGAALSEVDSISDVLVAPGLARLLQLDVGSEFTLRSLPRASLERCVKGERVKSGEVNGGPGAEPSQRVRVKGILEPLRLARRDGGLVVVAQFGLVARLALTLAPMIQVRRQAGADPDGLKAELSRDYHLVDERSALFGEEADERAFRNGVKVLGCLALVLGMFVIFHTLSHALAEKIRRVGILRSIGATQRQVTLAFLADAFAMSVVGVLLGLGLGVLLAKGFAAAEITTLGLGKSITTFEMPWGPLAAVLGLGVLVTLLGAAFPLIKVRSLSPTRVLYARDLAPPADLMRGVNVFMLVLMVLGMPLAYLGMTPLLGSGGSGAGYVLFEAIAIIALFFGVLLLSPRIVRAFGALPLLLVRRVAPLACFLVRKNLLRSPGRVATSVCGLTLVALAMIGVRALTSSLKGELASFASVALERSVFVKAEQHCSEAQWREVARLPGVESCLPLSAAVAMPFRCIGTDASELSRKGGALEGKPELVAALQERRGMVISARLAKLRKFDVGKRVAVVTDAGVVQYEVVAISDLDGFFPDERAFGLTDRRWFREDFCHAVEFAQRFSIRLAPDADVDRVRARAKEILGGWSWARRGEDVRDLHLWDIDRDFRFFDVLLWLLLLLAGVGQVNLITLTTISRAREIGVLRALGVTRGDFVSVLLVESLVVGFLSGLLALVAGIPLSWVLVRGLQAVSGLETPYVVPWGPALAVAGLSFVVALAAALVPALRATSIAAARAVRASE